MKTKFPWNAKQKKFPNWRDAMDAATTNRDWTAWTPDDGSQGVCLWSYSKQKIVTESEYILATVSNPNSIRVKSILRFLSWIGDPFIPLFCYVVVYGMLAGVVMLVGGYSLLCAIWPFAIFLLVVPVAFSDAT